jgi:hypothetical protein
VLIIQDTLCAGVGKTCLLLRYANDSFSPTFITTIGIDFKIKNIELDGKRIKLQVQHTLPCAAPRSSRKITPLGPHADLGHCRPRAVPYDHHVVLQGGAGACAR